VSGLFRIKSCRPSKSSCSWNSAVPNKGSASPLRQTRIASRFFPLGLKRVATKTLVSRTMRISAHDDGICAVMQTMREAMPVSRCDQGLPSIEPLGIQVGHGVAICPECGGEIPKRPGDAGGTLFLEQSRPVQDDGERWRWIGGGCCRRQARDQKLLSIPANCVCEVARPAPASAQACLE